MGTGRVEFAVGDVRFELRETVFQFVFQNQFIAGKFEGGEARCVDDIAAADLHERAFPRRVTASPQLAGDLRRGEVQRRVEGVEERGLADPGVPGEGTGLPFQERFQFLRPLPGQAVGRDHRERGLLIGLTEFRDVLEVGLVEDDDGLDALADRDGGQPVDDEGVRAGISTRFLLYYEMGLTHF